MESPQIVIGLGNPGPSYRSTRHNVGFRVVDLLAERRAVRFRVADEMARRLWAAEVTNPDGSLVVLAKPRTYMNRSGRAAAALCRHYEADPKQLLTVYDDADLAFGRLRLRHEGGAGGHNGIRSMMETLGSGAFPRVRLGVCGEGREDRNLADYVLEPFATEERSVADQLVKLAADAVEAVLEDGVESAMNRFNGRSVAPVGTPEEE